MIPTDTQELFDSIVLSRGGTDNLSRTDLEVVAAIVKAMHALRTASPADVPRIIGTVAKLMEQLPPKPEAPPLDLSKLSDQQLHALETHLNAIEAIHAVARGEKPKLDLSALSDEQLAILRRARRIMDGKDSAAEPQTNGARDRIIAKVDEIRNRREHGS
jgi:hypothetical protein